MQIFQKHFKSAQGRDFSTLAFHDRNFKDGEEAQSKDIVSYKHSGTYRGSGDKKQTRWGSSKAFKIFKLLCRRDVATACFESTLNLKQLNSLDSRRRKELVIRMMEMKQQDQANAQKTDSNSAFHSGNRVLPISEPSTAVACDASNQKKEGVAKGDKNKTLSRMKELIRWAAATKSEKGGKLISRKVMHFRTKGEMKLKPAQDNNQLSNESPKISLRLEAESCSTTSSAYSSSGLSLVSTPSSNQTYQSTVSSSSTPALHSFHCKPKEGSWITTDSEFVVLEL